MTSPNFFDQIVIARLEVSSQDLIQESFEKFFDKEIEGLAFVDFQRLAHELFTDSDGETYPLPEDDVRRMFDIFDLNHDEKIDSEEFQKLWVNFVVPLLKPKTGLIVVDVQNDFIDGTLALRNCPAEQEGVEVIPAINQLLEAPVFDVVVYTCDWHPENHVSFVENKHLRSFHSNSKIKADVAKAYDTVLFQGSPPIEQTLWPRHCVKNSWGSQLHPDLTIVDNSIIVYKGTTEDIDSYSAFWDNQKSNQTDLNLRLKEKGITDLYLCGLAYDYCVGYTALHALEHGYRTVLIEDACRGVSQDGIYAMQEKFVSQNGVVIQSSEVTNMVLGLDRKPEFGYLTASAFKRSVQ